MIERHSERQFKTSWLDKPSSYMLPVMEKRVYLSAHVWEENVTGHTKILFSHQILSYRVADAIALFDNEETLKVY